MKKICNLIFWIMLAACMVLCCVCFRYANNVRTAETVGGEVFTIAAPLVLVWIKMKEEHKAQMMLVKQLHKQRVALNYQTETALRLAAKK